MNYVWVFLKGLAMGAADVVPGVSGGTIAFITGIYARLLTAITQINFQALRIVKNEGVVSAWKYIDGNFLVALGVGILTAIITLARVIHYLLMTHPIFVWSFFFGLIIASCWHIGRTIKQWRGFEVIALCVGAAIAAYISVVSPTEIAATLPVVFIAGSIAICAMILPGISGSFMLLLMGLYGPIMGAIHDANVVLLGTFMGGAVCGLLLFSRLLSALLQRYESVMLSLLTGFMVGSLVKVWPWKETVLTRINSHGVEVPFIETNVLPAFDQMLLIALVLAVAGAAVVLLMERVAVKDTQH
ncbi:MAG: DUF368 domain-containing protein [Oleibacter sp.]|nr:DUF368 domain-containing protein [Thalassolituus sp.]